MPTEIEKQFNEAMLNVYSDAKRECGYTASRFLQMVTELGGRAAAQRLLEPGEPSDGFAILWERGGLHLSLEAVVLEPQWRELFTDHEVEGASRPEEVLR